MPVLDVPRLIENRVTAIRRYHEQAGIPRAELDVSGGVDSAVMAGLLTKALGPQNVTAVFQNINSSPDARKRAQGVVGAFGLRLIDIDLTPIYRSLIGRMEAALTAAGYPYAEVQHRIETDPTILGSIRSCLRAPVGRGFNRMAGDGIRHGTGNEDEDRWLRFYNKGGDGEVDTNPIGFLSKGEVYQLALGLGVPTSVILARPSPDLWGNGESHNDEDEIRSYLGLSADIGHTMYSYVNSKTGKYIRIGLIERVNRFLDDYESRGMASLRYNRDLLFKADDQDVDWPALVDRARVSSALNKMGQQTEALLRRVHEAERRTRHKENPNIPMLGSRRGLLNEDILTDELPKV